MTRLPRPNGQLTPTELRVITELARGYTRPQIARMTGTTTDAINQSVQRASRRLGARTTEHLFARAIGLRLIPAGIALTDADRRPATGSEITR